MVKEIALTFDDGPWGENTDRLQEILIDRQIPATFMLWGEQLKQRPEQIARVKDNHLFAFGNHTWSHPSLPELSQENVQAEIQQTADLMMTVLGQQPAFMRPPYGDMNQQVSRQVSLPIILWSLDTRSWEHHDANQSIAALQSIKDGDIVLLHDSQLADVLALPTIIDQLQQADFVFKTIPDLLVERMKAGRIFKSRDEYEDVI